MVGFFAFISKKIIDYKFSNILENSITNQTLHDFITSDEIYIERLVLNKFLQDKVCIETELFSICFDGVVLNLNSLLIKNSANNLEELLLQNINCIKTLIQDFRGSFSGLIYNKKTKNLMFFTDHFAHKTLFYAIYNGIIIVSSEVFPIVKFLRNNGIKYEYNPVGLYSMITYGYMYEDNTMVEGINRVKEGEIHTINLNGSHSIDKYFRFKNSIINIKTEDAIEQLDYLFKEAVKLQYEKNLQNGYSDNVPLSAGLDCRMTSFVLKEISQDSFLNFTYSETEELDFVEPSRMAKALGNKWLFKSLDNGLDLLSIEQSVALTDSLIYYAWPAQLNDFMKLINTEKWGIVHTGVIGDVVIGLFNSNKEYYELGDGAFSKKLIYKLKGILKTSLPSYNYQLGMMRNRAINGACLGYSTTFKNYAIDLSPFMNVDFFDFCLSLPLHLREHHKLYYDWVNIKYPEAAKFKHNGISINGNAKIKFLTREVRLASLPYLLKNRLINTLFPSYYTKHNMNPFEKWYSNNLLLRQTMSLYFKENIDIIQNEYKNDLFELYNTGNTLEKILVISLLGSLKALSM